MKTNSNLLLSDIAKIVNSGTAKDVDYLMSLLTSESPLVTLKMVDFAISQINTREGKERIKFYLFEGTEIQRNYALLYFKRHANNDIILEAVIGKHIDEKQAFSR